MRVTPEYKASIIQYVQKRGVSPSTWFRQLGLTAAHASPTVSPTPEDRLFDARVMIRLTHEQKRICRQAAAKQKMPLSAWFRELGWMALSASAKKAA